MPSITWERREGVCACRMDNGKANAINGAFLEEFDAARRASEGAAMLLRGYGRFFSAGLDIVSLMEFTEGRMREFLERFHESTAALFLHPGPVVAEINGHAIGGGAILALCADWRLSGDSPRLIGLNEAKMGLVLPPAALEAARHALTPAFLHEALFFGELHAPQEALRRGFVHEVVPDAELPERAAKRALALSAGGEAFIAEKKILKKEAAARMERHRAEIHEVFLKLWFSAETRGRLEEAREKLGRK